MTLNEAGAVQAPVDLSPDWHNTLTDTQLQAYIRYQYLRHYNNAWDWDDPIHAKRRPSWDGGKDRFGVKHTAVWGRIARAVRNRKADPGLWVAAHFSPVSYVKLTETTREIPDIRPGMLAASDAALVYDRYLSYIPKMMLNGVRVAGTTIAHRLRGTAALELSKADQLFFVLCDEAYVSANDFYRHAFAAQLGCDRAVERYLWCAALDYEAQQRVYDLVLKDESWCFTEALVAAVDAIREHWRQFA